MILSTENQSHGRSQTIITAEEAIALTPIAISRMVGSERFALFYQIGGAMAGFLAGALLTMIVSTAFKWSGIRVQVLLTSDFLIFGCALSGWAIGIRMAQNVHQARFLAGIRRRGAPKEVIATFAIEDNCLRIVTPRINYGIAWDAILELIDSASSWLIQVDTTTFILPKRAFSSPSEEQAFISQLLRRIRPEAKARSALLT